MILFNSENPISVQGVELFPVTFKMKQTVQTKLFTSGLNYLISMHTPVITG